CSIASAVPFSSRLREGIRIRVFSKPIASWYNSSLIFASLCRFKTRAERRVPLHDRLKIRGTANIDPLYSSFQGCIRIVQFGYHAFGDDPFFLYFAVTGWIDAQDTCTIALCV